MLYKLYDFFVEVQFIELAPMVEEVVSVNSVPFTAMVEPYPDENRISSLFN